MLLPLLGLFAALVVRVRKTLLDMWVKGFCLMFTYHSGDDFDHVRVH